MKTEIYLPPKPGSSASKKQSTRYLVFFITGNPGLVEYYRTFLTHLYALLSSSASPHDGDAEVHIYGRSLGGYEVNGDYGDVVPNEASRGQEPLGLQAQTEFVREHLTKVVEELGRNEIEGSDWRVILVGHSVGTYIMLEIIEKLRRSGPNIVGGICLMPTVVDIAKSSSGTKVNWIATRRGFALLVSLLARFLTIMLPFGLLLKLVQSVTGMPSDAAQTTTAFLKSPWGVRQALYMGRDELLEMTTDHWSDEVWGAATTPPGPSIPRPKLIFFFSASDHWIAAETREKLIMARGVLANCDTAASWKPKMLIDETGTLPHDYPIKHSVPVAERVKTWVEEIVAADTKSRDGRGA